MVLFSWALQPAQAGEGEMWKQEVQQDFLGKKSFFKTAEGAHLEERKLQEELKAPSRA